MTSGQSSLHETFESVARREPSMLPGVPGGSGLDGSFREEVAKPLRPDHVALLVVKSDGLLERLLGFLWAAREAQNLAEIGKRLRS